MCSSDLKMLNIKYDIVGSFLRPKEIHDARRLYFNNEISLEELTKIEDVEIAKLVKKEVEHGLKIVTDGEFRRRWWHLDWLNEFDGFETIHLDKIINGSNHHIELGHVVGKISYDPNKTHREVLAYDFLFNEVKKYPGVIAKKSISGPNMILIDHLLQLGIKDTPYYGNNVDKLIDDIATSYQEAIKDFYNHGCRYLQIDDTSWTYMIDDNFNKRVTSLGYEKNQILDMFKRVSTKALENKPKDMQIATHFCKGNFKGKPLFSGFYDSVAPVILSIPYDGYFVEYDDARSGSFLPWARIQNTNATFVVGLISTKTTVLETKEEIKNRFFECKKIVGDNIALSPQCGFASVEEGNSIEEETQWKKIDLLVSCEDFI